MKYLKKLLDSFGSAGNVASVSRFASAGMSLRTCSFSRAQRLTRIPAVAEILDGPVDPLDATVERWTSKELSSSDGQPQRRCERGGCHRSGRT